MSHWRQSKNVYYRYKRALSKNPYFINCDYMPCKLERIFFYDVQGIDCEGKKASCAFQGCSPDVISKDTYDELSNYISEHGYKAYTEKYLQDNSYNFPTIKI